MSLSLTSVLSAFRHRTAPSAASQNTRFASSSTYSPRNVDTAPPPRHPRPSSPLFFTGRPRLSAEMTSLEALLRSTEESLRRHHIFPLPRDLPQLQPPGNIRWKSPEELTPLFGGRLKMNPHRRLQDLLNDLNRIRYLAELGGRHELAQTITGALETYLRNDNRPQASEQDEKEGGVDEYGRSHGLGKRKEASARVWIIPSQRSSGNLDAPADAAPTVILPTSEVLINHLPLPQHFQRPYDRDIILRPLRITGLIGAYNVFALVRGGGPSGQAGAVALGLAKALDAMRADVHDVLMAGGLAQCAAIAVYHDE